MQSFRNRLYNFESPAPKDLWTGIVRELDKEQLPQISKKGKTRVLYYALAAAAALVIIFMSNLFFNQQSSKSPLANQVTTETVNSQNLVNPDSVKTNKEVLESIIQSPKPNTSITNNPKVESGSKKYVTISGPEGQPIKISRKAASLIVSIDNEYPPKPVWDKKIEQWKQMMLSSTTVSTAEGLMDMLQAANNMEN